MGYRGIYIYMISLNQILRYYGFRTDIGAGQKTPIRKFVACVQQLIQLLLKFNRENGGAPLGWGPTIINLIYTLVGIDWVFIPPFSL